MDRRKRSRPDDERERRESVAPPAPAHPLLELQRGAGNRAVSSLLARSPDTKEKPKEEAATGTRATLPDIGTIALISVQFGGSQGPGRRREKDDEKDTSGEIVVSSRVGKHSTQLQKASLDGKPMTVEVFIAGGSGSAVRLELKGTLISSYSAGSDGGEGIETWTLNFKSMEQSFKAEETE